MKFRFSREDRAGAFTLIELLVVIAIIGILASIVLASLNTARQKGRDVRRTSDLKELQLALEFYYDAYSKYPKDTDAPLTAGASNPLTLPGYISSISTDPSGGTKAYGYKAQPTNCDNSATTCTSYLLGAILETQGQTVSLTTDYDGDTGPIVHVDGNDHNCNENAGQPDEVLYCVKN